MVTKKIWDWKQPTGAVWRAFNCYNESFTNMNNHNIKRPGKND